MPAPKAPFEVENTKSMYWRLNQPVNGGLLEVYCPTEDDWLPARFVTLPGDGHVRVKWASGGGATDLPSHRVRNVGDGDGEDPPVRRYLHNARPDWSESDVAAVVHKLKVVGIAESRALYEAVLDEANGHDSGVNALLRAHRQRTLVPRSLQALRVYGERLYSRPRRGHDEPRAPEPEPSKSWPPEPRREARAQLDARERGDGAHGARGPSGRGQELDQHDNADARAVLEAATAMVPTDEAPQRHVPASARPAKSDAWAGDSFLASKVCCSRGHPLSMEPSPYDVNCDECGEELDEGVVIRRCDACAYDLCQACHVAKQRRLAGLPEAQRAAPPSRPRVEARVPVPMPPGDDEPRVYCPNRHLLKPEALGYDIECNYCSKEMCRKVQVWGCGFCGYFLCEDCHAERAMD